MGGLDHSITSVCPSRAPCGGTEGARLVLLHPRDSRHDAGGQGSSRGQQPRSCQLCAQVLAEPAEPSHSHLAHRANTTVPQRNKL